MQQEIQTRLESLLESIQLDKDSLHSSNVRYPTGQALFDRLFDAVQSTLQNTADSSADVPE
jgi:hypothetical protein